MAYYTLFLIIDWKLEGRWAGWGGKGAGVHRHTINNILGQSSTNEKC